MANESVLDEQVQADNADPGLYGAKPLLGNYTDDTDMHLWCAASLAHVITGHGREAFDEYNANIRDGVLFLLSQEIERARKAYAAETSERAAKLAA